MSKESRRLIAQETLDILKVGSYPSPVDGRPVDVRGLLEVARAGSFEVPGGDSIPRRAAASSSAAAAAGAGGPAARVHFSDGTSLEALYAVAPVAGAERVMLLNFASAKNPGGGFLGGAQAQEESLARSSGLYPCLTKFQDHMYARNKADPQGCLYSDDMIFSPSVPFFREDRGGLLPAPVPCSVITAPAPNAGAVHKEVVRRLVPTLLTRMRRVLQLAAAQGLDVLILGAWGCGVFRNDPKVVAEGFKKLLDSPEFRGCFSEVHFAIPDKGMLRIFASIFGAERPGAAADALDAGAAAAAADDGDAREHAFVDIQSFGHGVGRGVPAADLVFDARHVANPEGGPKGHLTGVDARLRKEILKSGGAEELLRRMVGEVRGRLAAGRRLRVAVGCEAGKHRSVALALALATELKSQRSRDGLRIVTHVQHREEDTWDRKQPGGGAAGGGGAGGGRSRRWGKDSRKDGRVVRDAAEIEAAGG